MEQPVPLSPPAATSDAATTARSPLISVVTPAFNQAGSIAGAIEVIEGRLRDAGLDYELIVVSDGSSDDTYGAARRAAGGRVRVLGYTRNLGKGYALRSGSVAARGSWIAWIDSDLDLDPAGIPQFLEAARAGRLDVVIGSKRHPESEVRYPWRRRAYSWLYQQLVRVLFGLHVRDTQVGIKLFRREVLDQVLPVVLVKRYAFDLEILALAHRSGFRRIEEAPIRLDYRFEGSGVNWRAIANALWDTAAVFYRLRLLRYYDRAQTLAETTRRGRTAPQASLSVIVAPEAVDGRTAEGLEAVAAQMPGRGRVLLALPEAAPLPPIPGVEQVVVPGDAEARMRACALATTSEVVAFLAPGARPSGSWVEGALPLFGDPEVAAVVGPVVPELRGSLLSDAGGVLTESRLGLGGARMRHAVGSMRTVDEFPLTSLFVRGPALRELLADGAPLDDTLCGRVRRASGMKVVCSPDVVVTAPPTPLFLPYLRAIFDLGRASGRNQAARPRPRMHHVAPVLLLLWAAAAPLALTAGPAACRAWLLGGALYAAALTGLSAVTLLLHRRAALAAVVPAGAVASHVAAGLGLTAGVLGGSRRRVLPGRRAAACAS